ncbi:MAG: hypothetical protein JWO09_1927 [Bacteroidetes bacterium]|nr:hypothetical protein [Bacteroidota bacterium]
MKLHNGRFLFSALSSKNLLRFIALLWLVLFMATQPWKKNQINGDVTSYYAYLPATFIYHDLKLEKSEYKISENTWLFWPLVTQEGKKVIKTTMGLSVLYAPFFFIGHCIAPLLNEPQNGYSTPYQFCLLLSAWFYLLTGLYFLRKLLLLYFSDGIAALSILTVYFGTNLFWYSTLEGLMSHGYIFSMLIIFIYQVVKWHRAPSLKRAIAIGFLGGLLTLIRPTMILCFLIFLLFDVYSKETFLRKVKLLQANFKSLLLIGVFSFLVIIPQLLYWHYVTGHWLFFSYEGERFYFDRPHLLEGLFGFRKGWLLYTPIMCFAIIGLFFLRRRLAAFFLPVLTVLLLSVYVLLSWWAWWYGGGFGLRAFVDFYGLFILPIACFYQFVIEQGKRSLKYAILALGSCLVYLNLFQTWQYYKELIHFDSMTKEAYMLGFRATYSTAEWYEALDAPGYERAKQGLPEAYSAEEVRQIRPSDKIILKGNNFKMLGFNDPGAPVISSCRFNAGREETFSIIYTGSGNTIYLKASNNKFVCADHHLGGKLIANRDAAAAWETFELMWRGNNKIALKADNGKYVRVTDGEPFELIADSDSISKAAQFRIFIN